MIKCNYGCGQEAKFLLKLKSGKETWCCSDHYQACPEVIKKTIHPGVSLSKNHRLKISKSKKGKKRLDIVGHRNPSRSKKWKDYMVNGGSEFMNSFPRDPEKMKKRGEKERKRMLNGGADLANSFPRDPTKLELQYKKLSERMKGDKHPNYNPNREQVFAPYTEEFATNAPKVRERDNYTCQLCFKPGKTVHHIDENKKNSRMENMINLCQGCNTKIHTKDKGIWVLFYQPYFETITKRGKNGIIERTTAST
jgi:5-methylcytosine-specific restriction endonuclease McrA